MANMKRYITVVWCFLETLFFGGLIYGWGSLVFILKDEDVYADLCDGNQPEFNYSIPINQSVQVFNTSSSMKRGCNEQDSIFTLVFTVASFLFCAGCAVLGQVNYKFGTRVTRILSFLIFECGALMIAFVSPSVPALIFPGLTLIGVGGIPLLVTNAQIANLFQAGSSTIVGLMCGAFDGSSGVQLLVKLAHESGFSRQKSYFVLAGTHTLILVSTFLFLPKGFIPRYDAPIETEIPEGNSKTVEMKLIKDKSEEKFESVPPIQAELIPEQSVEKPKLPPLRSCILSSTYILHVMWVCVLQLRFYYYIASLNPWLDLILERDHEQVSYFTNVSMYMLIGGIITSPLVGVVFDLCKLISINSHSELRKTLLPAVPPLIIGSSLGVLLSILVLIPSPTILYVIFIVVTIYRSFLYSVAAAFLNTMFPSEYFGLLYGWMVITAGIFSFLQYALFKWSEATNFSQVNIFFLCFMFVSFFHPLYQWWRCRKAESVAISED
ncbi:hypothetical protein LOTGIDRAFT_228934 [Lottia gigantea]|uniref:Major facilitator superfamily (MFS) profile domain-containing protein n=1 Tax=Lottia gigantea TaxID=225164 RepID=V3ZX89_LOTGI|nr:hypothetical protein LOTGIDRAFT_228934 [Lottia gigantea]ESO88987.1 hypothetical protein LOTGIDRAFT_228934 [Lottia gigantea]